MNERFSAFYICLLLLLAACGSFGAEPTPTPTPTPSPADYLQLAAEAMAGIDSVQFTLSRGGTPVIIEPTLGIQFVSAEFAYQAPDQVHASAKVELAGNFLLLDLLWLPDGNFMSNPLTGMYGPMPQGIPLDPVAIFDPEEGVSQVLLKGIQSPENLGMEDLEGIQTRHLRGNVSAEVIQNLTPLSLTGTVTFNLWLDLETNQIVRAQITEENGDISTLDFFGYNEPVTIPSPNP